MTAKQIYQNVCVARLEFTMCIGSFINFLYCMSELHSLLFTVHKTRHRSQNKVVRVVALASLKSLTYLALIHFLLLLLCILITIIFCLVFFWEKSSNQVHQYETRLASQYGPHFCRTNIKQFSILYRGPKIWKSLPISLSSSPSIFVY